MKPEAVFPQQWIHPSQPAHAEVLSESSFASRIRKYPKKKVYYVDMHRIFDVTLPMLDERTKSLGYTHFKTTCKGNNYSKKLRRLDTFTERQWELGQRTGSKSLIPVIVPMYL